MYVPLFSRAELKHYPQFYQKIITFYWIYNCSIHLFTQSVIIYNSLSPLRTTGVSDDNGHTFTSAFVVRYHYIIWIIATRRRRTIWTRVRELVHIFFLFIIHFTLTLHTLWSNKSFVKNHSSVWQSYLSRSCVALWYLWNPSSSDLNRFSRRCYWFDDDDDDAAFKIAASCNNYSYAIMLKN